MNFLFRVIYEEMSDVEDVLIDRNIRIGIDSGADESNSDNNDSDNEEVFTGKISSCHCSSSTTQYISTKSWTGTIYRNFIRT